MHKDIPYYEDVTLNSRDFPVAIFPMARQSSGAIIYSHWHEQIELLYFIKGKAIVSINSKDWNVEPGDLIVINSNEIHSIVNTGVELIYYVIIVDLSLLGEDDGKRSLVKNTVPATRNHLLFRNKISENCITLSCLEEIISENENKASGFVLAIKSHIYKLLSHLVREHTYEAFKEADTVKNIQAATLYPVLKYIENNFTQRITLTDMAHMANLNESYFCRIFKRITGKTLVDYVNTLRVNKADLLLHNSNLSVKEIALCTGFDDINYFSRIYKKYKGLSPSRKVAGVRGLLS
jgi:AraC-like DNA-binding protein/mannose-6-phosphate isomerase-like protein (cupin superfamily)